MEKQVLANHLETQQSLESSSNSSSSDEDLSAPPRYSVAVCPATLPLAPSYQFVRRNLLTSKVLVRHNQIDRYCFATDHSSDNKVWMYAGTSKRNEALGCLTFPTTHNTFRIHFGITGQRGLAAQQEQQQQQQQLIPNMLKTPRFSEAPLTEVQARIGSPHPKAFSFKLPTSISFGTREYVWVYKSGDIEKDPPVRYDLYVHNEDGTHLATLTVTNKKGTKGTGVEWKTNPRSELEQAFTLLSAVGIITRLSRKGKLYMDNSKLRRHKYIWWLAAMGTASVM